MGVLLERWGGEGHCWGWEGWVWEAEEEGPAEEWAEGEVEGHGDGRS